MENWSRYIQTIITQIDACIRQEADEALTLRALAQTLGYSEAYTSRKFRAVSGMTLTDYIRGRRLAFAVRELRGTDRSILDIASGYGFLSNEAFTRAFQRAYGTTPSAYRKHPTPLALRTVIHPFDCYLMQTDSVPPDRAAGAVKTYFVRIPAHRFLHVRNYESIGYWDFWQKQSSIPGQDCETICGLLDSIPGKLDGNGQYGECDERAAAASQTCFFCLVIKSKTAGGIPTQEKENAGLRNNPLFQYTKNDAFIRKIRQKQKLFRKCCNLRKSVP